MSEFFELKLERKRTVPRGTSQGWYTEGEVIVKLSDIDRLAKTLVSADGYHCSVPDGDKYVVATTNGNLYSITEKCYEDLKKILMGKGE